jgi:hypothetical protein
MRVVDDVWRAPAVLLALRDVLTKILITRRRLRHADDGAMPVELF